MLSQLRSGRKEVCLRGVVLHLFSHLQRQWSPCTSSRNLYHSKLMNTRWKANACNKNMFSHQFLGPGGQQVWKRRRNSRRRRPQEGCFCKSSWRRLVPAHFRYELKECTANSGCIDRIQSTIKCQIEELVLHVTGDNETSNACEPEPDPGTKLTTILLGDMTSSTNKSGSAATASSQDRSGRYLDHQSTVRFVDESRVASLNRHLQDTS